MDHRQELTVSRRQVDQLLSGGQDWEQAGRELGISPGLAFMVQTGIAADGSGVPELGDAVAPGPAISSPQSLLNPRGHNPLSNESVLAWVGRRAKRELLPPSDDGSGPLATAGGSAS